MRKNIYPSKEYKLINSLKPLFNFKKSNRFPLDVGDDTAIRVCLKDEKIVLTTDNMVENIHFSLKYMNLMEVGYKTMAINLSDIASMGAIPDCALVQVTFPEKLNSKNVSQKIKKLYRGMNIACNDWNFPIIGGNLSKGPCWIIDVTMIGKADKRLLYRKGAKCKDNLWVSGFPGESSAGLYILKKWGRKNFPYKYKYLVSRHIKPSPRINLANILSKNKNVHALIDISDGISKECFTLAYENNMGIVLEQNFSCVSNILKEFAKENNKKWQDFFYHGGEDYELLFAASRDFDAEKIIKQTKIPLTKIGYFTKSKKGVYIIDESGKYKLIEKGGWDHL